MFFGTSTARRDRRTPAVLLSGKNPPELFYKGATYPAQRLNAKMSGTVNHFVLNLRLCDLARDQQG
jgi:hypothetical protein